MLLNLKFNLINKEEILDKTKPFIISKHLVMKAYKLVKKNQGSAGIDQQGFEDFNQNLQNNLYKIWNRLSSGSYFPPAVMGVSIPKKSGGERILGIPTISDRIAQMVVMLEFEPEVEPHFYPDSYGYRPNKSALDAVGITRRRCWKYDWVLEFDIKGLFDNIDHNLLMKAVKKHTNNKWVILYIERWLKAPMQMPDGTCTPRSKGTPQGGVISPILSNLFLHYVFDVWISKHYPRNPWCRYADDGVVHANSESEAETILLSLKERFKECKLELHPEKTRIVYCKDENRKKDYPGKVFTFLGYDFRCRTLRSTKDGSLFQGFAPAVSKDALKAMKVKIRKLGITSKTGISLEEIADITNPIIRGWIQYYGCYNQSALSSIFRHFNRVHVKWAMRKYKKLKGRKRRAYNLIQKININNPNLFAHWKIGMH